MKQLFIIALATALPFLSRAQNGYASIALGYMPSISATDHLCAQLTVGGIIANHYVIEYNQLVAISYNPDGVTYAQVRIGYSADVTRQLTLRLCAGYSITTAPADSNRKAGHGIVAVAYLLQQLNRDLSLKYELSFNNGFHPVPTVGALVRF